MPICKNCQSEFVGRRDKTYCSSECKRVLDKLYFDIYRAANPERFEKYVQSNALAPQTKKPCAVCQNEFTGYARRTYCSQNCQRQAAKTYFKAHQTVPHNPIICGICATEFQGTNRRKYCSTQCRLVAGRRTSLQWYHATKKSSVDTQNL